MSAATTNGALARQRKANGVLPIAALPGLVVERLPLAGHARWKTYLPTEIRLECEAALGAMIPRCTVELYVPDQDFAGRKIDVARFLDELQREVSAVVGGQTSLQANGEYFPLLGQKLSERTVVLKTFLPTIVNDELRLRLLELLLRFGVAAQQDVVQTQIASSGFSFHTGLLRERPDVVRLLTASIAAVPR
jgi:hypothetical protein